MNDTRTLVTAIEELFADLDAERFDAFAERLDEEIELADELTGEWLRGRERVGAYLLVQRDIVTDVRSTLSSVRSSWLSSDVGLVTFIAHQEYRLDGTPRSETLSGSAVIHVSDTGWRLRLFHLGEAAGPEESDIDGVPTTTATAPVVDEAGLGETVRRIRAARGLSLRALGDRTGLSPSLLSQVERGVSDPSLASLRRLADALGVGVSELLGEGRQEGTGRVVRRTARSRVLTPDVGALHELLSGDADGIDARIVTIDPSVPGVDHAPHAEPEFMLVLEGVVVLELGNESVTLYVGDAATVDSATRHRVRADTTGPARFLWVAVPRSR